jgi:uridine kinase
MTIRLGTADLQPLAALVRERAGELARPCIVAIDGRSGAGKSTLAARLAQVLDAIVLDGDGFFAGGVDVRGDGPEDRARDCIDWRRLRSVLEALRAGQSAGYLAFDWHVFDGRLELEPTHLDPHPVVLVDGVYAARPELRDLIDLCVLVRVRDETRITRLLAREGGIGPWERQWHEAEAWYFDHAAPPLAFDVIVDG